MTRFNRARTLALAVPSLLMAGALVSQHLGGLYPCEMCMWQRWPHEAAIVLALFAFAFRNQRYDRTLTALAAVAIMISGAIGFFHAGVEYGWWEGLTQCATTASGVTLEDILAAPVTRCDVAPWSLFGISLAGYNGIISVAAGLVILALLRNPKAVA
jgi:disulfide bond formation protein DsbB